MNTPIANFLKEYKENGNVRFHMPGHKGRKFLGCEPYDITEIFGADNLYNPGGIISLSENNATKLFGTAKTLYSTEGSSQCIRAMVHMATNYRKTDSRPHILAARNAHKAFLYALALADADVTWLYPEKMNSLCSCGITAEQVEKAIEESKIPFSAVYITTPDYLGGQLPVKDIAEACHEHGILLMVDNAHGAYLHFLPEKQHPMDFGADLCCDSAHKTLPVLTGGAYLHIADGAPKFFAENTREVLALFGSTSPSYLTLASLDLCNDYLSGDFVQKLSKTIAEINSAKKAIADNNWELEETEPFKITIKCPKSLTGTELAKRLRTEKIECEYADNEYLVLMASAETSANELARLKTALGKNTWGKSESRALQPSKAQSAMSIRKALYSSQEVIPIAKAEGRICAAPTVSCPPAIPIVVSGEIVDKSAIKLLRHYGIEKLSVVVE